MVAAEEDKHVAVGGRGLAVNGGNGVKALVERERGELGDDVLGALDLLACDGEHGAVLVEVHREGQRRWCSASPGLCNGGGVLRLSACVRQIGNVVRGCDYVRGKSGDYGGIMSNHL
ncbi:hypothetical protein HN51_029747 [Arachis hypogaea]